MTKDLSDILEIFFEARPVPGLPTPYVRQDDYGAWMSLPEYGKTTPLGWQQDHVQTKASGGSDSSFNLRALQWFNNQSRGDDRPFTPCTPDDQLLALLEKYFEPKRQESWKDYLDELFGEKGAKENDAWRKLFNPHRF